MRHPRHFLLSSLLFACIAVISFPSSAQIDWSEPGSIWRFNAYGTLGTAYSTDKRADYIPSSMKGSGAGRSHNPDFGTDSRLAAQISATPNDRLSAVVQVVFERQKDSNYKPDVEWANIQYQLTPELKVRIGRIALGTYMVSNHRKVGQTLPWIRPPADFYYLVGVTNSDGIDFAYRRQIGRFNYTAEFNYGYHPMSQFEGELMADNITSLTQRIEHGPLTLHTSYSRIKLRYGGDFYNDLWGSFESFGSPGTNVRNRYDADGKWATFITAGLKYDHRDWFIMSEWGSGDSRSDFGRRAGWYISAGYRFDRFIPYLTYARATGEFNRVRGLDSSLYPAALSPTISQLNNFLELVQQGTTPRQKTLSGGLRWDIRPNVSAKVQLDHVATDNRNLGLFRNLEPGYRPSGANVLSMSVDFVL